MLAPVAIVFVALPLQANARVQLQRQIPDASVFFRCPDVRATDQALQKNSIARLFEDPEVKEFLRTNPGIRKLESAEKDPAALMRIAAEGKRIPVELARSLVKLCESLTGECAFAVRTGGSPKEPEVYFTAGLDDAAELFDHAVTEASEWLETIESGSARRVAVDGRTFVEFGGKSRTRGSGSDPSSAAIADEALRVARIGSTVCAAAPSRRAMLRLIGPAPERSFAESAEFREADSLLGARPGSAYLYVDGRLLRPDDGGGEGGRHEAFARELGLDGVRWLGVNMEPDGELIRHRFELRTAKTDGFISCVPTKEKFQLATYAPANTLGFLQMAVDGKRLLAGVKAAMRRAHPKQSTEAFEASWAEHMEKARALIGSSPDEVAGLLGDEVALSVAMPANGFIPDFVVILRAASNDAARTLQDRIEKVVALKYDESRVRELTFQGKRIVYVPPMEAQPLVPSAVVDDDRLVFASNVPALKRYLQFRASGGNGLGGEAKFRDSVGPVTSGLATAYAWIDWPAITNFTYGNFATIAPAFGEGIAREMERALEEEESEEHGEESAADEARDIAHAFREGFDWNKLPAAETVVRYVRPQAVRIRIGDTGMSLESRAIF